MCCWRRLPPVACWLALPSATPCQQSPPIFALGTRPEQRNPSAGDPLCEAGEGGLVGWTIHGAGSDPGHGRGVAEFNRRRGGSAAEIILTHPRNPSPRPVSLILSRFGNGRSWRAAEPASGASRVPRHAGARSPRPPRWPRCLSPPPSLLGSTPLRLSVWLAGWGRV